MMDIIFINWTIGGVATLLMAYAVFMTINASKKLTNGLRVSILLIMTALIFYLLMGLGTGVMAIKNIAYDSGIWLIIPLFALMGSIFFVLGARRLLDILFKVEGNLN